MSAAKGIPTIYKDVQFRSRAEARWAAFFDGMGWRWDYEPVDFDGYIPDFLLDGELFVEVRGGIANWDALAKYVESSEWRVRHLATGADEVLVLGALPVWGYEQAGIGLWSRKLPIYPVLSGPVFEIEGPPDYSRLRGANLLFAGMLGEEEERISHCAFSRQMQSLDPIGWSIEKEEAALGCCNGCDRATPNDFQNTWRCRLCGESGKSSFNREQKPKSKSSKRRYPEEVAIEARRVEWAAAQNTTQWKSPVR